MADFSRPPAPDTYKGAPVPPRLRQFWDKPTGRWWRAGVDATLSAGLITFNGKVWQVDGTPDAVDGQGDGLLLEVWVDPTRD